MPRLLHEGETMSDKQEEKPIPPPIDVLPDLSKTVEERQELVLKANEAAERLERANAQMLASLERSEKLILEQKLGGKVNAGQPPTTEKDKEDEDVNRLLKGTGFEGTI